jgi:hypothetical protein
MANLASQGLKEAGFYVRIKVCKRALYARTLWFLIAKNKKKASP